MCGIAGEFRFDNKAPDAAVMDRMLAKLARRGPDSEGQHADGPVRQAEARMMVAGVMARAGLKDSAGVVARGAVVGTDVDPTRGLYLQQAFVFALMGDKPAAVQALKTYLASNPERRPGFAVDPGWRLRSLASDPDFTDLVGGR